MKLITRQTLANEVLKKWKRQYGDRRMDVYEKLKALGETPDPNAVDKIIGNSYWTTQQTCDECERKSDKVVQLGEEPCWESSTASLCEDCLRSALELLTR